MTDQKTMTPGPKAPSGQPPQTAADVLSLLKQLPVREQDKLRTMGMPIPQFAEGSDPTTRKYSYLCRNCGRLGLDFLGTKWEIPGPDGSKVTIDEPPTHIPFDRIATTQENGDPAAVHRSRHPRKPICRYCAHELALGPEGGIVPGRNGKGYVVIREPWEEAMRRELSSRFIRLRNFERENPQLFAHNVRPTGRTWEGAGQPTVGTTAGVKP